MDRSDSTCPNYRLRQERIEHNWRQQDVAEQVGTTIITVNRWERGVQQPSAYFRVKLCALFGKSAEELGLGAMTSLSSTHSETEASEEMSSSSRERSSLWTVPYRRNPYFIGRDKLLYLLDQHFSAERQGELTISHQVALTQPQAIKGLGGIGKTQIAVEYAYRAREQEHYAYILWVNAASEETLITSFVELAEMLPAFSANNETNQHKLVEAMRQWLERCNQRWLLIFDNADDFPIIQKYLPQGGNGNILITTRANAVGSFASSIVVERMGLIEGTTLLLHRAQRQHASDEEMNEASNIVIALDFFPLALDQAGAYIEETGCSFADYLQLYQTHHEVLLARRGAQYTNYPDSVATTWSLSFHKIEQTNPAAVQLLRLCAFLSPDHIPEELLTEGSPYWPPPLKQAITDLLAFNQMLEELLRFSLIKRLVEDRMLSLHRLVQVVQLDKMKPEEQRQWAERVVSAVNAVFPRDPRNEISSWPQCLRYLEQAQACDTLMQELKLTLTDGADLLDRAGGYLRERGSYATAEPLYQRAIHIREQSLGTENLQVADPLIGLANIYRDQGNYTEAEPLYQRAIHIREQSLGTENLQVAVPLNGLANIYCGQGKYIEAEPLYLRAIHVWEQSLGPEHPQVAYPLNNLANTYREQGKYTEAEPLSQRALRIREQSLGPEHPLVVYPLNNLAAIYMDQGNYTEAEPLYQRALHICEQSLGPDHPNVAYPLNNLAELYRNQGNYIKAEPLYQRALHIWEQSLGPDHPNVAHPLNGLANIYLEQVKYIESELLFQRALHIREYALKPNHPDIADTLYGFAALREVQGKSEESASLYSRALAIREKVYGQHHSKTSDIYERLYALLQVQGKTEVATVFEMAHLNQMKREGEEATYQEK